MGVHPPSTRTAAPPSSAPERSWLLRPLWYEDPLTQEYRRGRLLVTGPYGALIGLAFGVLAAQRWGLPTLPLVGASAVGGFLVTYVLGQVESFANAVADRRGPHASLLVRVGTDVFGGAFFGRLMASVLDADAIASLATGAAILVAYSAVATRVFWGGWVEGAVHFLTGQAGRSRTPDYSRAAALIARGEIDEALTEYETFASARPHDPDPPLHAAWTLRDARLWDDALHWFRRALDTRTIDARRATVAVRQVWEIEVTRRGDPAAAIPDLRRVVRRFGNAPEAAWARRELAELVSEYGEADET